MDTLQVVSNLKTFFHKYRKKEPLRVILAYSGGLDSSVLLFLINKLPFELVTIVGLAHVNHNLREESGNDAQFSQSIAKEYGIPFFYLNVCPLRTDLTNEAWGRETRYQFFEELRVRHKADYIITAHHSDDEIETFIFRLIMGRNNLSLSLIKEFDEARGLLRPLLEIRKSDLKIIAAENKINFIEDKSNDDSKYARNYIRNEILPKFEKINPAYRKSISQFVDFIREDSQLISNDPRIDLNFAEVRDFIRCEDPLALRALIALSRRQIGDLAGTISLRKYQDLLLMLRGGFEGEKLLDLGSEMTAVLDLRNQTSPVTVLSNQDLRKREKQLLKHSLLEKELILNESIVVDCPISNRKISIVLQNFKKRFDVDLAKNEQELIESFGLDLGQDKILVRGLPENEFISLAVDSRKRVTRLLKEKKIPRIERRSLLYLSAGSELIWVPKLGRRSSDLDQGLEKYSIRIRYDF